MQAQYREIHGSLQGISTSELRPRQLECLFILLLAFVTSLGRIADIPWSRLLGLVTPIMRRRSPSMIRSGLRQSVLAIVCALLLSPLARAQTLPDEPAAEPVRREILAVYDSREEARPDETRIHRFAEMPLNHLGFVVSYWDVNAGLPGADRTENIRGVITWFRRAPPPLFYLWGQEHVAHGIPMVVLGDSGLPSANTSLADANKLFAEIGFGLSGAAVDITYGTRILQHE